MNQNENAPDVDQIRGAFDYTGTEGCPGKGIPLKKPHRRMGPCRRESSNRQHQMYLGLALGEPKPNTRNGCLRFDVVVPTDYAGSRRPTTWGRKNTNVRVLRTELRLHKNRCGDIGSDNAACNHGAVASRDRGRRSGDLPRAGFHGNHGHPGQGLETPNLEATRSAPAAHSSIVHEHIQNHCFSSRRCHMGFFGERGNMHRLLQDTMTSLMLEFPYRLD